MCHNLPPTSQEVRGLENDRGVPNLPPTSQEVRDLENDRGRPNSPKAYRLYNK